MDRNERSGNNNLKGNEDLFSRRDLLNKAVIGSAIIAVSTLIETSASLAKNSENIHRPYPVRESEQKIPPQSTLARDCGGDIDCYDCYTRLITFSGGGLMSSVSTVTAQMNNMSSLKGLTQTIVGGRHLKAVQKATENSDSPCHKQTQPNNGGHSDWYWSVMTIKIYLSSILSGISYKGLKITDREITVLAYVLLAGWPYRLSVVGGGGGSH